MLITLIPNSNPWQILGLYFNHHKDQHTGQREHIRVAASCAECSTACTKRLSEVEYKSQYVVINHYPLSQSHHCSLPSSNSCADRTRCDSGVSRKQLKEFRRETASLSTKNDSAVLNHTERLRGATCAFVPWQIMNCQKQNFGWLCHVFWV